MSHPSIVFQYIKKKFRPNMSTIEQYLEVAQWSWSFAHIPKQLLFALAIAKISGTTQCQPGLTNALC